LLGLQAALNRAPHALSRGQRLRVAVGAALTCAPTVFLLDEPTAGQDHTAVQRMLKSLSLRLGADAALIFATHDVALALRWATRVVVLENGRVIADGPPSTVLTELPPASPVVLPPLAELCRSHGLPVLSVDALVEAL
jgi:energy-coupling factor transport system ATP-binding protein